MKPILNVFGKDAVLPDQILPNEKVYAIRVIDKIYKLQHYNKGWIFGGLHCNFSWSPVEHETAEEAVDAHLQYGVYEFDTLKEFLQWALEQIGG